LVRFFDMNIKFLKSGDKKLYGLFLGSGIFLLLVYPFTFGKTIDRYKQSKANQALLISAANAPQKIQDYQTKLTHLEGNLSLINYDRNHMFDAVNGFCRDQQLVVANFAPEVQYRTKNYILVSNTITVRGAFKNMVELTFFIEKTKAFGHVASQKIERVKDQLTRKEHLQMKVVVQNIIPQNNSEI